MKSNHNWLLIWLNVWRFQEICFHNWDHWKILSRLISSVTGCTLGKQSKREELKSVLLRSRLLGSLLAGQKFVAWTMIYFNSWQAKVAEISNGAPLRLCIVHKTLFRRFCASVRDVTVDLRRPHMKHFWRRYFHFTRIKK